MKRSNMTLLGHKDHGKSTLIGRLLYDTKSVMADRVEEVRRTSEALGKPFEYAFLLDSFQEEREGGMTIDVIHAQIKGEGTLYDCIDVPGHKELIKNMLTGASHADAGILIVSAKEGIEEQTGHHLRLAEWLGLDRLVIAVNKMDLIGYDQALFEEMKRKLFSLAGAGAGLEERTTFVPVSAYLGENVVVRSAKMPWYTGPTLFQWMETLAAPASLSHLPFRFPVQDIYRGADGVPVIAGRVESGTICVGQAVRFALHPEPSRVAAILTFNGKKESATAGENVGMVLEHDLPLKRGEVCSLEEEPVGVKHDILAHAIFLESPPKEATIECGTAQTEGKITYLSPPEIGEVAQVAIHLKEPMAVERSKTGIGRLALKHRGKIIGVAVAG
ncbi:MAG: GTP-binding protein [Candidatus Manganitrophaceae bacterium]